MAGTGGLVLVGVVAGAHGVRGAVRVRSFTERPADLAAYGPLTDEGGRRRIALTVAGPAPGAKGGLIARIAGVEDRAAAAALRGLRLYVPRAALPEPAPDEYYRTDLIGLAVELPDGSPFGRVAAVHDFGAGDVLEIERPAGGALSVPFTKAVVPVVDPASGRIVLDPPPGLLENRQAPPRRKGAKPQRQCAGEAGKA